MDRAPGGPDEALDWAHAHTLGELGELTARWLEGTIPHQPAWEGTRPDAETEPLVPVLAALNRAGFVTHYSQSGMALASGTGRQRAAVSGFGSELLLRRLPDASLGTDLVCLVYPPGGRLDGLRIPISYSEGVAGTWAGAEMRPEDIREFYGPACHRDAVEALLGAWQATVIDPRWGRNDLLWDWLRDTVCTPGGPDR